MTTGKTIALTRWTFVGKVMSLLFHLLSMLVIVFLPRSKHLLISWLQSPSAVILEPPKLKSVTVSLFPHLFVFLVPVAFLPTLIWSNQYTIEAHFWGACSEPHQYKGFIILFWILEFYFFIDKHFLYLTFATFCNSNSYWVLCLRTQSLEFFFFFSSQYRRCKELSLRYILDREYF